MPAPGPAYMKRFMRVIEHISDNLDGDLDLNNLSEVAALSPWHWHRIWQATFEESIVTTVRRMRLYRAAIDLGHTDMPLDKVASRAGYGSQAAFNRSFKQIFKQTPAVYRARGGHKVFQMPDPASLLKIRDGDEPMYELEIREIPSETLAAIRHVGPYAEIGKCFEQLVGFVAVNQLFDQCGAMIGLYFSDPTSVPEAELQSAAAIVAGDNFPFSNIIERLETRGGDYAVLTHKGPYSELASAYQWLYGAWVTTSSREPDDAPAMEIYLNNPRDTAPNELLTQICMPLKPVS